MKEIGKRQTYRNVMNEIGMKILFFMNEVGELLAI